MYRGYAKPWRLMIYLEIAMWFPTLATVIKEDSGAAAIEYGLIVALVSVVVIGALTAMGGSVETTFQAGSDALTASVGG